jgi:hypothetical protein
MIGRREFIRLVGGAAAWPLGARAQQRTPVVGILAAPSPEPLRDQITAFRHGLNESGFIEGRDVTVQYYWAEGHYDRLPAMAGELIAHEAAVHCCAGTSRSSCGQGGNRDHSHRVRYRCGPSRTRTGQNTQPARRKCYRREFSH